MHRPAGQRVFQPVRIIALGEILTGMRAAALGPANRPIQAYRTAAELFLQRLIGPSPGDPVVGTENGTQAVPAVRLRGAATRGVRSPCTDLRPVHRMIRDIQLVPGQGADRETHGRRRRLSLSLLVAGPAHGASLSLPALFTSATRVRTSCA